eukprot:4607518-Prymnesium_polylepis.1
MSREPALEVGECPVTRHRPQVRRVTHTHTIQQIQCTCIAGDLGWRRSVTMVAKCRSSQRR